MGSLGPPEETMPKVGKMEEEEEFEAGKLPPFCIAQIRSAIPKHCWIKDPWWSLSYVVRDVIVVAALAVAAAYVDNWVVWLVYWLAQGTMFWAMFVLGHDWYVQLLFLDIVEQYSLT